MTSSTSKKVQIRRFERESLTGFVNPLTFLQPEGIELLSVTGVVSVIPYEEVKSVRFVRDFDAAGSEPERRTFLTRPKLDGLWVRLRFRDEDVLDGVIPNNLLQVEPYGFTIVPPDLTYSNQRLFVPKAALTEVRVLGVINAPQRRQPGRRPKVAADQPTLFDTEGER